MGFAAQRPAERDRVKLPDQHWPAEQDRLAHVNVVREHHRGPQATALASRAPSDEVVDEAIDRVSLRLERGGADQRRPPVESARSGSADGRPGERERERAAREPGRGRPTRNGARRRPRQRLCLSAARLPTIRIRRPERRSFQPGHSRRSSGSVRTTVCPVLLSRLGEAAPVVSIRIVPLGRSAEGPLRSRARGSLSRSSKHLTEEANDRPGRQTRRAPRRSPSLRCSDRWRTRPPPRLQAEAVSSPTRDGSEPGQDT